MGLPVFIRSSQIDDPLASYVMFPFILWISVTKSTSGHNPFSLHWNQFYPACIQQPHTHFSSHYVTSSLHLVGVRPMPPYLARNKNVYKRTLFYLHLSKILYYIVTGIMMTVCMGAIVGCRARAVRRRLRRGKLAHDADYLVNGMYL